MPTGIHGLGTDMDPQVHITYTHSLSTGEFVFRLVGNTRFKPLTLTFKLVSDNKYNMVHYLCTLQKAVLHKLPNVDTHTCNHCSKQVNPFPATNTHTHTMHVYAHVYTLQYIHTQLVSVFPTLRKQVTESMQC